MSASAPKEPRHSRNQTISRNKLELELLTQQFTAYLQNAEMNIVSIGNFVETINLSRIYLAVLVTKSQLISEAISPKKRIGIF